MAPPVDEEIEDLIATLRATMLTPCVEQKMAGCGAFHTVRGHCELGQKTFPVEMKSKAKYSSNAINISMKPVGNPGKSAQLVFRHAV